MQHVVLQFYEGLADEYHFLFADWREEVIMQGEALDTLIRRLVGPSASTVLDCACGIGTQAIGLAKRGYTVYATDFSPTAIERAAREAASFGAALTFTVADFRALDTQITDTFDVVLCCDNALSHMLEDTDLSLAVAQMRARLKPGGLLLASIRDYDLLLTQNLAAGQPADPGLPGMYRKQRQGRPRGTMPRVFDDPTGRRIAFQVWDWTPDGRSYMVHQFFVREVAGDYHTTHHVSRFRALRREELNSMLQSAGFSEIRWHMPAESGFYQPIVSARRSTDEKELG